MDWVIETKRVRLGLIGLGYIGKVHLRNALKLTNGKLVAVADISKRALNRAKKMGVKKTFSDYRQLMRKSDIDAVIVALPTHLHKPCALCAAEADKDILLEKPLARNPREGSKIVQSAESHGVKLMVGYPFRFNPSFRSLKQRLQRGTLGEVQTAIASFVGSGPMLMHRSQGLIPRPAPSWWFDRRYTGGGALIDLGCHLINLLRWYLGEIVDIRSYISHRFNLDLEDYANCLAKFSSGKIAHVNVGWYMLDYQVRVELFGTVGHAFAENNPPNKVVDGIQRLIGRPSKFYQPHFWELKHFVGCVKNDMTPTPSGRDALRDLEVISLAYERSISLGDSQHSTS